MRKGTGAPRKPGPIPAVFGTKRDRAVAASAAVDLRAVDEGLDDVRPGVQRVPVPDRQVGVLAGLDGPHPLLKPQMLGGTSCKAAWNLS